MIRPDHSPLAADAQLPPLAVAAAAGFCAAVWADERVLEGTPLYFGAGLVGLFVARRVHRYRCLGLVPLFATVATLVGLTGQLLGRWPGWAAVVFPLSIGLAAGGILRFRDTIRTDSRRFAAGGAVAMLLAVGVAVTFTRHADPGAFGWLAVAAAAGSAAAAWLTLFRPTFEYGFCLAARLVYKPRAVGPGLAKFPMTGPALVIANHGDWFDPPLVGGLLPRQVTALMTSAFFDKPGMRWLMTVFGTIRVLDAPVRRAAPEIDAAVQALDAGRVVLLLPEGYLRRKEEVPLRRFGQGVWKILAARPGTPVVPVWVEGTWGSFFSFQGGPPTTGKRFRLRHPVTVGVGEPLVVPAEVLANRMGTRLYLMQKVADARPLTGAAPLPPVDQLPPDDRAADGDDV